ncbi:CehA/McbA family metallohydrolase [Lysobacter yananisis]|uniref:CehA/McbA family metallohydrolase n=1 Tax=Lysobacter yananisis TaxID=1003114 RepID=A0ABY9P9J4_9GAMM|nr:CehA/McbA family metallohydrolase [Lysobacter yananisis]WMT03569.1 CehA/McbA family metallohydrolase [Lysobacter yananisis]
MHLLAAACALAVALAASCMSAPALAQGPAHANEATHARLVAAGPADLILQGRITGADNQTYRELPFQVPAGTARIEVEFDYDRSDKTTIDLGLLGPGEFLGRDGFRGWSGGNKRRFSVAASDATASYSPGALTPGEWKLLLGIPNIRAGGNAAYTARIRLTLAATPDALPQENKAPLRSEAGWYRGDLHMHSAHSDGNCAGQSGARAPCPLFLSAQAAVAAGLDFVAVTEHNTVSHLPALRELQPHFDRLLLIPGMEITTFQGHANVFGVRAPVDFRVGSAAVPDWNAVLAQMRRRGLAVSINHPIRPSDERCMGCGWTPRPAADLGLVSMVEAINGGDADTPGSGIAFWQRGLDAGHRLTGVGGSDNHDAPTAAEEPFGPSRIGRPTTVVHARELSEAGILDGLRAGNVFVDAFGSRDRLLELRARHGANEAAMGGELVVPAGQRARLRVQVRNLAGGRVEATLDGAKAALIARPQVSAAQQSFEFDWPSDGRRHWLRIDVRDAQGRLALMGNPVYFNWSAQRP